MKRKRCNAFDYYAAKYGNGYHLVGFTGEKITHYDGPHSTQAGVIHAKELRERLFTDQPAMWKMVEVSDVPETPTTNIGDVRVPDWRHPAPPWVSFKHLLTRTLLERHTSGLILSATYPAIEAFMVGIRNWLPEQYRRGIRRVGDAEYRLVLHNDSDIACSLASNAEHAFHGFAPSFVGLLHPEGIHIRDLDTISMHCQIRNVEDIWRIREIENEHRN